MFAGQWEWKLLSNDSNTPASQGRVEVMIDGQWGSVCPAFFTHNDADAICRTLGYLSGDKIYNK
jgi:deleted-in-malignant-brain-tumors protein 1